MTFYPPNSSGSPTFNTISNAIPRPNACDASGNIRMIQVYLQTLGMATCSQLMFFNVLVENEDLRDQHSSSKAWKQQFGFRSSDQSTVCQLPASPFYERIALKSNSQQMASFLEQLQMPAHFIWTRKTQNLQMAPHIFAYKRCPESRPSF